MTASERTPQRSPSWRPRLDVMALTALVAAQAAGVHADASASLGDAFARESSDGRRWEVGNDSIVYSLGINAAGEFEVRGLARPNHESAVVTGSSDSWINFDDDGGAFGDKRFRYLGAEAAVVDGRVVLTLGFGSRTRPVQVERRFAVTPGAPVIEMWTSVDAQEDTTLHDLSGVVLEVKDGRDLWWQRGLETGDEEGGPFTRRTGRLDEGQHVEFGSPVLSSQEAMPWFGLNGGDSHVFAGIAWSGAWRVLLDGTGAGVHADIGLRNMSAVARAGQRLEFPHAFIGLTDGTPGADAEAFTRWIDGRRNGRPFPAFATYNPWFAFGTRIDADLMRRQMDGVAQAGAELFQLDAGWYPPIDADDRFDFTAGLGSWQVDRERFPEGLGVLSDYAHERGLEFGVWVEPERIDTATVGRNGMARESFLATNNGEYQPGHANNEADHAQICLAEEDAWQWVRDRMFAFLDEARPDYLKIDLNGYLVCTRPDHHHPADGGNFAHTQGYYRLLAALRERYQAMWLENVSGGARRLDAELLTRTDAHWMDDRTAPAARVRHHLELLTGLLPPSALLSYLLPHGDEPLVGADDLPLLARSRMPGVMGLTVDVRDLEPGDYDQLAAQIADYKALRALRGSAFAVTLTEAVGVDGGGPEWDVLQEVNPASGVATVFAFRNRRGGRSVHVTLQQLRAGATYRIRSLDRGAVGQASADDLMTRGFDIDASSRSASQVFVFEPQ